MQRLIFLGAILALTAACGSGGSADADVDSGKDAAAKLAEDGDASADVPSQDAADACGDACTPCIELPPSQKFDMGLAPVAVAVTKSLKIHNCGGTPLLLDHLALAGDVTAVFSFPPGANVASGQPLVLESGDTLEVPVTCTPPDAKSYTTHLTFTDNSATPDKDVVVTCEGVTTNCATPFISCDEGEEVVPQTPIHLDASDSLVMQGLGLTYTWTCTAQPAGTDAYAFSPSAHAQKVSFGAVTSTPNGPQVQLNVVGTYTFRLTVTDSNGKPGCGPTQYTVQVIPETGMHLQLLWDTPNDTDKTDDSGADLDLHLAHPDAEKAEICTNPAKICGAKPCPCQPDNDKDGVADPWFAPVFDCYWFNPLPNWGDPGSGADDPFLALDDTNGWGPENLDLLNPQAVLYRVGVHYWDAHSFGDSTATVTVWLDQAAIGTFTQKLTQCDFWWVKRVDYAQKQLVDFPNGGPNGFVTPAYSSPLLASMGMCP